MYDLFIYIYIFAYVCFKKIYELILFSPPQGSGLKWFEFKAVLSALGEDLDDEQVKKILDTYDSDKNGILEFGEFIDFMVKRRTDNDSEEEILAAFREIAGGRDYITETEIAPLVTPKQLAYIKKTMPQKEGVEGIINIFLLFFFSLQILISLYLL